MDNYTGAESVYIMNLQLGIFTCNNETQGEGLESI